MTSKLDLQTFIARSAGAAEYTASLQRGKPSPPNECPVYDTKQSDGEFPVILKLWGMLSTLSLSLLPSTPALEW